MIVHRPFLILIAVAALPTLAAAARADDAAIIDRWYAALLAADRARLSDLLADDATIKLADLGIEQGKAEFIASMDEWETAIAGVSIRHRIEASEVGVTTVVVCYDFPANDLLTREIFTVADGRIAAGSQAAIAESCDAY